MDMQTKTIFKRIVELLEENTSRTALLAFFLFVFSWPYISFIHDATPAQCFGYLFVAWLLLVFVLWIANSGQDRNGKEKQ
jgi:hypothetical protein